MRAIFDLHRIMYGLALFACWALISGNAALAKSEHDHTTGAPEPAKPTNHMIKELALPEGLGSSQSIAVDSAGRVWFTEKIGKKLGMYDPDKKEFVIHPIPASWGNIGFSNITLSPDGEIWFTVTRWADEGAEDTYMLGKFTPTDGYFTKYDLPHKSIPEELIIDAKGIIWFFASNKNNLYRVDSKTFSLKGYPIPTENGHPRSLASDQNGHIWFVESNANKIGNFIPEQEIFHEYEVLTPFANPGKISIDQHGRIWFVEVTANRIGVFSPDKKRFDEVIIPTPGSSPVALANDNNGNIWFLEYKGNKVGVFNAEKATFHEYDIPNYSSLPANMAIDHKRSILWFTQSSTEAKRLGMLPINDALAAIKKQDMATTHSAVEKASSEGNSKWILLLAAIIAIALLGGLLARKSRKGT